MRELEPWQLKQIFLSRYYYYALSKRTNARCVPCISANVRGIVMHDTTSRAVKQESKRKRGFCVKVPLVIISALWGNKDGEETRSDRTRGDRPRLLFGSYGKLGRRRLFHEVCLYQPSIQNVIQLWRLWKKLIQESIVCIVELESLRLATFDRFSFDFFSFLLFVISR